MSDCERCVIYLLVFLAVLGCLSYSQRSDMPDPQCAWATATIDKINAGKEAKK